MSLFDKKPSLMPVVIAPDVWQSAVEFPADPQQVEERLGNLLLAVLLTLRTAGTSRKKVTFTIYCQPPQGDMKVPVALPLSLNYHGHYVQVWLNRHNLSPPESLPDGGSSGFFHEDRTMDRSNDIYQKVTDQIIAELENGNVPWIRPWRDGEPPFPINALSGRPYHGINVPLLWNSADKQSFASDRWLTFHQVSALGAQVRRGEKSSLAVLYLPRTQEETDALGQPLLDENGEPQVRHFGIIREFRLFNLSQCDGLPQTLSEPFTRPAEPVETAEAIAMNSGVTLHHRRQSKAYYKPATDLVMMPHPQQFESSEAYYATLLHELTHATGHASRLNRPGIAGTERTEALYAAEELVAEMGSAFLCAHCGILGRLQHASYIGYWLDILRQDKRAVIRASGMARHASEWLLNAVPQPCQLSA